MPETVQVWHFILDHRAGGPHAYVAAMRSRLENQVSSVILTTGSGPLTDVSLINLRHLWLGLYGLEIPANVLSIVWKILQSGVPRDSLIFNVHGSANIAPIVAARLLAIPVVWHFHETLASMRPLVHLGCRLLRRHPHRLVSVSASGIELLNLKNATVVPAPVDTDFWSRGKVAIEDAECNSWRAGGMTGIRPTRVLMVGNLNPLKGADILLEALTKVEPPWHLKIAGADLSTHREYCCALKMRAAEITNKIDAKVEFLGWQDSHAVRSLLASCDVFVLPSRSEACPTALLEAMSMGTTCIATRVGDTATILSEGRLGTLVPMEDSAALSGALREFSQFRDATTSWRSIHSRERVISDFSIDRVALNMLGIYRSLVSVC